MDKKVVRLKDNVPTFTLILTIKATTIKNYWLIAINTIQTGNNK